MMNNAVVVDDLVVHRGGHEVLRHLSFSIAAGQVTGLLGPSGCGKSTLMRAIVGVQRLTSGSVQVLGAEAGSAPLRDRIGYVTQDVSVYDDLTVGENLAFFARVLGAGKDDVDAARSRPSTSGRRSTRSSATSAAGSARAPAWPSRCSANPSCWCSTSRPSASTRCCAATCGRLFHRIADGGAAVLVSSHVMDEAERCDRLLLMRDGVIIADDTPDAIRAPHR